MKCCLWNFFIPCGILLQLMFQIVVPNVTKKDFCCRVHYHHPLIPCKWPFPLRVVVWVSQQYQNRVMEFKKRQKLCMLTSKYIIYPCFCHYDNTKEGGFSTYISSYSVSLWLRIKFLLVVRTLLIIFFSGTIPARTPMEVFKWWHWEDVW